MSWAIVAMTAAGLLKSELVDKPRARKDRQLQAKTAELSPWTGMKPSAVKEADPFGTALQFGSAGALMNANKSKSDFYSSSAKKMDSGGSLGSSWSAPQFEKPKSMLWDDDQSGTYKF